MFKALFLFILSTTFATAASLHGLEVESIEGEKFKLEKYKGKPILLVNIASQCGYTPQLEKLQKLHDTYQDKGLVVIGVPSNDFGGQTPQDNDDMKKFCSLRYGVKFPLLSKSKVLGKEKSELYKFLTESSDEKFRGAVGWNFEKFLISKDGLVVGRFKSSVDPLDKDLVKKITENFK
jgi:glutathione peroxidase